MKSGEGKTGAKLEAVTGLLKGIGCAVMLVGAGMLLLGMGLAFLLGQ